VLLTVAKRAVISPGNATGADNVSMKANVGRLYMVDLAGSERLKKSMSTGTSCYKFLDCLWTLPAVREQNASTLR